MAASQIDDHVIDVVQGPNYASTVASRGRIAICLTTCGRMLPTYTGPSQATLRGKTFVVYSGSGSSQPARSPALLRSGRLASLRMRSRVQPQGAAIPCELLRSHWPDIRLVHRRRSRGQRPVRRWYSLLRTDAPIDIGDYTYTGTRWDFTPGVAASWALQGEAEPTTSSSDGGLTAGQVRDQVKSQIQAGPGINVEADGTGETQTLEISRNRERLGRGRSSDRQRTCSRDSILAELLAARRTLEL